MKPCCGVGLLSIEWIRLAIVQPLSFQNQKLGVFSIIQDIHIWNEIRHNRNALAITEAELIGNQHLIFANK
jgi:hypothetical protein